jgi:hypothetical protein
MRHGPASLQGDETEEGRGRLGEGGDRRKSKLWSHLTQTLAILTTTQGIIIYI